MAYGFDRFEPFASFTYEIDIKTTAADIGASFAAPDTETAGGVVGAGLRYFSANGISGSAEYTGIIGRGNFTEHSISLLLRAEF